VLSDFGYELVDRISELRYLPLTDLDLAMGVTAALIDYEPATMVRLGSRAERIDLIVNRDHHHVGIECRVTGSTQSVQRQLVKYAKTGRVSEIILVTTKNSHVRDFSGWTLTGKRTPVPVEVVRARHL
jgi:hypothetical protein